MFTKRAMLTVLSACGLVSAATVLPAQAVATAPLAPPVITPAQAATVFAGYTVTENKANKTYDQALMDTVLAGSARQLGDADYRISQAVGYAPYLPVTHVGTRILMARQTGYPAEFLVLTRDKWGSQKTQTITAALLFQKADANSDWQLTNNVGLAAADVPSFAVDSSGYLPTLAVATLQVAPAALAPALLKAETLAEQGHAPSAAWADDSLWKQDLSQPAAWAHDQAYTFSSSHLAPVCLAATKGAVCFASSLDVRLRTLTAAETAAGSRWTVKDIDSAYDDGGLAAGSYTTMRTVQERQVVVVVPRKKAGARLVVTGDSYGPISGKGTLG